MENEEFLGAQADAFGILAHPQIGVRVEAQPWNDPSADGLHVASAYFVFVAIDEEGRSREVPPLVPETPDDLRRHREAEIRRAHRLARKSEIEAGRRA